MDGIINTFVNHVLGTEVANTAWERKQAADNLAYQRQVQMWNMQNRYSSPAAQMQRYVAAGLNPNLIYGQPQAGNSIPSVSEGGATQPYFSPIKSDFLSSFLQLKSYDLNASKVAAEIRNIEADTAMKQSQTDTNIFNLETEKGRKDLKDALLRAGLTEKQANTAVLNAQVNYIASQINLNDLYSKGLKFDNEFKERTLENRILNSALANAYLDSQIKFINSRSDLSKVEKQKLIQEIKSLQEYNSSDNVMYRRDVNRFRSLSAREKFDYLFKNRPYLDDIIKYKSKALGDKSFKGDYNQDYIDDLINSLF